MNTQLQSNGVAASFTTPDPRLRIAAFVILVVAAMAVLSTIPSMVAVLVYVVVVRSLAGARASDLAKHLRRLSPFVVLIVLLNGWVVRGEPALSIAGRAVLSREGLVSGVFFSARLGVLYMATVVLVATTPPEEFAAALFALLRPVSRALARRAAFYGFVSMSFVPLFVDEFHRIRVAQSFRGGALSGGLVERARGARLLIVPLVLSAIHRSGQLAMVTELRGLKDRLGESLSIRPPAARDVALVAATLAVVACAAMWLQ